MVKKPQKEYVLFAELQCLELADKKISERSLFRKIPRDPELNSGEVGFFVFNYHPLPYTAKPQPHVLLKYFQTPVDLQLFFQVLKPYDSLWQINLKRKLPSLEVPILQQLQNKTALYQNYSFQN